MAKIIEITDFSDPNLDVYARLTEAQLLNRFEPAKGMFIAESPKVIHRALDAGYRPVSLLMERKDIEGSARDVLSRCGDIPVYTADDSVLAQLTGYHLTRGVLCAMRRPPLPEAAQLVAATNRIAVLDNVMNPLPGIEEICAGARRVAVLENVMNPTNVGAIFRSAAALGMDAVLLTPGCSDPLYRRSARVSMGTVFQIPWTFLPEDIPWPEFLRSLGFKSAALALTDDSVSIDDPKLAQEQKLALALGSEGDGLACSTIAGCDYTVKIPMYHGVDSLNVAAASAVAFWELRNKQGERK